jgi:hypothetical protein
MPGFSSKKGARHRHRNRHRQQQHRHTARPTRSDTPLVGRRRIVAMFLVLLAVFAGAAYLVYNAVVPSAEMAPTAQHVSQNDKGGSTTTTVLPTVITSTTQKVKSQSASNNTSLTTATNGLTENILVFDIPPQIKSIDKLVATIDATWSAEGGAGMVYSINHDTNTNATDLTWTTWLGNQGSTTVNLLAPPWKLHNSLKSSDKLHVAFQAGPGKTITITTFKLELTYT